MFAYSIFAILVDFAFEFWYKSLTVYGEWYQKYISVKINMRGFDALPLICIYLYLAYNQNCVCFLVVLPRSDSIHLEHNSIDCIVVNQYSTNHSVSNP